MKASGMINGVDVDRMSATIDAINDDPGIAAFRFRTTGRWTDGGHTENTIHDFYGARQTLTHKRDFHIDTDEPDLLLGKDQGANPVELVLTALAGCLTTSLVYHAAARGIQIRAVETSLEGELDLRGFLGLSDKVRNGYKSICVNVRVDADAPQETLDELIRLAQQRSPVYDIIHNPVDIQVKAEPMMTGLH